MRLVTPESQPFRAQDRPVAPDTALSIDCADCVMRLSPHCADCLVTHLVDTGVEGAATVVHLTAAEAHTVTLLTAEGLLPTLRHRRAG